MKLAFLDQQGCSASRTRVMRLVCIVSPLLIERYSYSTNCSSLQWTGTSVFLSEIRYPTDRLACIVYVGTTVSSRGSDGFGTGVGSPLRLRVLSKVDGQSDTVVHSSSKNSAGYITAPCSGAVRRSKSRLNALVRKNPDHSVIVFIHGV